MTAMQFVRVKDPATGHEFDVPETDWRLTGELLTRVKADRYPPVSRPRPPKFHVPLSNVPTTKKTTTAVESKKESTDD